MQKQKVTTVDHLAFISACSFDSKGLDVKGDSVAHELICGATGVSFYEGCSVPHKMASEIQPEGLHTCRTAGCHRAGRLFGADVLARSRRFENQVPKHPLRGQSPADHGRAADVHTRQS